MNTKIIKFDLNEELYEKIVAKQGDTKSRFLLFNLLDGAIPFNLTNRSVRVYGLKKDGTEIFNDLIINDATKGYCTLELTNQILAIAGEVKLELMIIEGDKKLTSNIFTLEVRKSINSNEAVESSNEFISLLNALKEIDEWNREFADKSGKLEELYIPKLNKLNTQLEQISTIEIVADIDGTSYKVCDKVDIEMLRQIQNKNFFTFMKKIRNREVLKIVCIGDSLTYGSDATSSDKRPASDVVNSDGSQSGVTRASITYPEALENYLNQVYRSTITDKLITVETRAYPGDWAPKSFNRHFLKHDGDLTIIMLGTNDSRRANYADAGDIGVFYYWLEQIIIRELLWDKAVLLLTPPKELSLDLAVDAFANAVHGIGNKYNIPVIYTDEFVSQYPASIYSDPTHFNGIGYSIVASRTAATLVGEGAHKPKYVLSGSVLLTRRTLDNVSLVWNAGYSGSTSSYAPAPNELENDKSLNVFLNADNGEMIYSFYA